MSVPEDMLKKLQGIKDSRGSVGMLSRGKNMYPGGNAAQQGGGPQFGRPKGTGQIGSYINAAKRRLAKSQI